ncbi:hypothetical protein HPP92_016381 [Vanilla planifolia]|uniref:Uncharacterized protein n=1 Tax=Vanilla planifolia TaxID=51239 RepID=A0A835UTA7_VANPL|nr:hypothetical protein HPP92_016381 [Vanilla planifolia]
MTPKVAFFLLVSLFLFTSKVPLNAEEFFVEAVTPVSGHSVSPAPAPHPSIFVNFEECPVACKARCRLHSRQGLCNRVCMTCCKKCKCVPPGTYGNREMCGACYTEWTTHGNRSKCP